MSVARATLSFAQLTAPIRYLGKNNSVWTVYSCPLEEICALKYLGVSSLYIYIGIYYINISVSTCKKEYLLFLNHRQRFFFHHWVLSSLEISSNPWRDPEEGKVSDNIKGQEGKGESKGTKRPGPESFVYVKLSMVFHQKLFFFLTFLLFLFTSNCEKYF